MFYPTTLKPSHVVTLQLINDSPKNIVFVGDESLSAQGLLSGFNSACKKHNITPEPAITCTKGTPLHAKQVFSNTLLNNPSIDAVVCANNIIAHGVLAGARI
ncbi:substrate-binding domain-containing protein [Pseudoalteromonas sp. Hal099]